MENTMGNIERFVKFGDVFFYARDVILTIVQFHMSLNEGSAKTKSIITAHRRLPYTETDTA